MKILLTGDTNLIDFNGEELTVAELALPEVEALTKLVAVVVDGERVFRHAKARFTTWTVGEPLGQELVELRMLSQGTIMLPRGTKVRLDGGLSVFAEALWNGPCDIGRPAREGQRKVNNEWQSVRIEPTRPAGAAVLQSWTMGVVEIVQNKAVVTLVVPAQLYVVEVEGEALGITAPGAGVEIDGILVEAVD